MKAKTRVLAVSLALMFIAAAAAVLTRQVGISRLHNAYSAVIYAAALVASMIVYRIAFKTASHKRK